MQATLVAVSGRQSGTAIQINGPKFVIGSHPSCHLRLKDPSFPDYTCLLQLGEEELWIVNESREIRILRNEQAIVGRQQLLHGDRLQIGQISFVVRLDEDQAPLTRNKKLSEEEICEWLDEADSAKVESPSTRTSP